MASLVCELIAARRIKTTLPKAKAARRLADNMVTLGKEGTLAARRRAIAKLRRPDRVHELFSTIAPAFEGRAGGYTRIVRIGQRQSDSSDMAYLEWVETIPATAEAEPAGNKK